MDQAGIKLALGESHTLKEAEFKLKPIASRAMRWGLWDGWNDRPYSEAGLSSFNWNPERTAKAIDDYVQGYGHGIDLRLSNRKERDPFLTAPAVVR